MSSCNENSLDVLCTCSSKFAPGDSTKIYDTESQEYVCCGKIKYDAAKAMETASSAKEAGALMDDPRCNSWWNSTSVKKPNAFKLESVELQAKISGHFPPPNIKADGTYSCEGVKSSNNLTVPNTVPKYITYLNPNSGDKYIDTISCVPRGTIQDPYASLKNTPFSNEEDFAIFNIVGCETNTSKECKPFNSDNALGYTSSIGSIDFSSTNYGGGKYHDKNGTSTDLSATSWNIILLILVLVFITFIILMFVARSKRDILYSASPQIIDRDDLLSSSYRSFSN